MIGWKIRSVDSLEEVIERHENSSAKISLLHKFSRLRLGIDNILRSTIWDEVPFISIGKTGLNPVGTLIFTGCCKGPFIVPDIHHSLEYFS